MSEGPGRGRGERGSITSKRSFDGCEEEKKESSPKKHSKTSKIVRQPGESILLDTWEENETEAIAILMENFVRSKEEAKMVLKVCRRVKPDDPALFVTFGDADRIHQALSQPGPGRPCPPGADANASYDALKQWVMDKIPTGARTGAVLVSGAANAVAFGNLSQAEFNVISTQITFHPNNFAWVAAIRANGLSCGLVLQVTGTGVGAATVAKLASTIFFDD